MAFLPSPQSLTPQGGSGGVTKQAWTGPGDGWFVWVCPTSGDYYFDTRHPAGTDFKTTLSAYAVINYPPRTSADFSAVTLLTAGSFGNGYGYEFGALIAFTATAGTEYLVNVGSRDGSQGKFSLEFGKFSAEVFGPCSGCTPGLSSLCKVADLTTSGAGLYSFGVQPAGNYIVTTCGGAVEDAVVMVTNFGAMMAAYKGGRAQPWTYSQTRTYGGWNYYSDNTPFYQGTLFQATYYVLDYKPTYGYEQTLPVCNFYVALLDSYPTGNWNYSEASDPMGCNNVWPFSFFPPIAPTFSAQARSGPAFVGGPQVCFTTGPCAYAAVCHTGGELGVYSGGGVAFALYRFDVAFNTSMTVVLIQNNGYADGISRGGGFYYTVYVGMTNASLSYPSGSFSVELLSVNGIATRNSVTLGTNNSPSKRCNFSLDAGATDRTQGWDFHSSNSGELEGLFRFYDCAGNFVQDVLMVIAEASASIAGTLPTGEVVCSVGVLAPSRSSFTVQNSGVVPIANLILQMQSVVKGAVQFADPANGTPCSGPFSKTLFSKAIGYLEPYIGTNFAYSQVNVAFAMQRADPTLGVGPSGGPPSYQLDVKIDLADKANQFQMPTLTQTAYLQ